MKLLVIFLTSSGLAPGSILANGPMAGGSLGVGGVDGICGEELLFIGGIPESIIDPQLSVGVCLLDLYCILYKEKSDILFVSV